MRETIGGQAAIIEAEWGALPRWRGVRRDHSAADVVRLRGSLMPACTIAEHASQRLWDLLQTRDYVHALGALTGGQAVQMVRAGLEAIYLSGWQVAGDANLAEQVYPDQSLYPVNSVPSVVRRIVNALRRADQIEWLESDGEPTRDWLVPIVADAEAGFGGPLNAYELTRSLIEAGAAGVHLEDQLAAEKKCGHMGGKVLVPTGQHVRTLQAARLAADVLGVPTVIIARTDALGARLITSDVDERDHPFLEGERTAEGFHRTRPCLESAIARGIAYAEHADLVWCETATPDLAEARRFAEAVQDAHPGTLLAYNCSPSFNWRRHLDDATIARFQRELGAMGYRFQFITLAGWHALNASAFELARAYEREDMTAYVALQERELGLEREGYTATCHQHEVGASYFDELARVISHGTASTLALRGSTEQEQFQPSAGVTR
jgi:isocitrate lyase